MRFRDRLGSSWEERLENLDHPPEGLEPHQMVSFPKWLYEEMGEELCRVSNGRAPLTIRVNLLKTTRQALMERFPEARPCRLSEVGLTFEGHPNLTATQEYREGLFEIQDEGSQLVSTLIQPKEGEVVLDYCAGAGGKSLAIAHLKPRLYLHDVRPLDIALKRLKRAGAKASVGCPKAKWIIVDAPCSGTGTLRRHPEQKYRLTPKKIDQFAAKQREIVQESKEYLDKESYIVYLTCSALSLENEAQIPHFETMGLEVVGKPLKIVPQEGGPDGFFGVVLQCAKPTRS